QGHRLPVSRGLDRHDPRPGGRQPADVRRQRPASRPRHCLEEKEPVVSDQSAKVVAWLGEQKQAMIDLLETLVNVDSGSYDKQGTDAAGQVLKDFVAARGIPVEAIPNETFGDALRASVAHPGGANTKPVVLMGHRDTVFPKGEAARRPFTIKGGRA